MKTTHDFLKAKENQSPLALMTAYDYPSAKLVEASGIDAILVGDSVGMVALGYDSTVPVTMDDMVLHTRAVRRGAQETFIITDMPFSTYHGLWSETLTNATRLMQEAGAHAIKLEGGGEVIHTIESLTNSGIPVMAHLGLTPQSVGVLGGYRVQGKDVHAAKQLMEEAKAVEAAGAFALVLECVPKQVTKSITEALSIPVIGIGAGLDTDGQILVYHDVVGYGVTRLPKFVKAYATVGETIQSAVKAYVNEVKTQTFPEERHSFSLNEETVEALYGGKSP